MNPARHEESIHEVAPRKPNGTAQAAERKAQPSRLAINRIVKRLQTGESEYCIARSEGLTQAAVVGIRQKELHRIDRALALVRVGLANVIELGREAEKDYWDDELEAA